jgi:hypothetical protein
MFDMNYEHMLYLHCTFETSATETEPSRDEKCTISTETEKAKRKDLLEIWPKIVERR